MGKPIFLDKPLADTYASRKIIYDLINENSVNVFSASSLRVTMDDTLEVMDLLDTAQRSIESGKEEKVNSFS